MRKSLIFGILASVAGVLLAFNVSQTQGQSVDRNAIMTLNAPAEVEQGGAFDLEVNIEPNGHEVTSVDAVIEFDDGVLTPLQTKEGDMFSDGFYLPSTGNSLDNPDSPLDVGVSSSIGSDFTATEDGTALIVEMEVSDSAQIGSTTDLNLMTTDPGATDDSNINEPTEGSTTSVSQDVLDSTEGTTVEIVEATSDEKDDDGGGDEDDGEDDNGEDAEDDTPGTIAGGDDPFISVIDPSAADVSNNPIQGIIQGGNFGDSAGQVLFDGRNAEIVDWANSSVVVNIPQRTVQTNRTVSVVLRTADGQVYRDASFTYLSDSTSGGGTTPATGIPFLAWPFLLGGNGLAAYAIKRKLF